MSSGFRYATIAAIVWAIAIILERILLHQTSNLTLTVAIWASIFELPYWMIKAFQFRRDIRSLNAKAWGVLLGIALVSSVGVTITEVYALTYSPAVNYSFLIRTVILFTILEAYIFLKEPLTKKKIILAVVILVGSYFLTTKGRVLSLSTGDILTITEALLISLGNNVLGRIAAKIVHSDVAASVSTLLGFIPLLIVTWWQHALVIPSGIPLIIALTICQILITTFRYRALKESSASFVTMIFSLTPVIVSVLAFSFLGESLTLIQIFGGLLIIAAGIGVEKLKI
ncbi:MAG TPA: DMT family transporter [Patescibacteria group bacterium]|nr:DMT family transporter [Patescibacteria group bacterium]